MIVQSVIIGKIGNCFKICPRLETCDLKYILNSSFDIGNVGKEDGYYSARHVGFAAIQSKNASPSIEGDLPGHDAHELQPGLRDDDVVLDPHAAKPAELFNPLSDDEPDCRLRCLQIHVLEIRWKVLWYLLSSGSSRASLMRWSTK